MKATLRTLSAAFTLCLLLAMSTAAATITIQSHTTAPSTTYPGSTCTLRIYSSATFTASDGSTVMGSTPGSGAFYKAVSCTVSLGVITIPQFTIYSTTDALDNQLATYTAIFYDSKGVRRDTFFSNFRVPITMGATITWAQLRVHNAAQQPWRDTTVYTKSQTDIQIQAAIGSGIGGAAANPTASVGLSTVNGVANTFMRSDAAPPLSQTLSPNMTGNWTFTPGIGLLNTAPVANTGIKINRTDLVGAAFGLDITVGGNDAVGFGPAKIAGRFTASGATATTLPDHQYLFGMQARALHSGTGRPDIANAVEALVQNGNGFIGDAYGVFSQVTNTGSGMIDRSHGLWTDVVMTGTSGSGGYVELVKAQYRNVGSGPVPVVYGVRLDQWESAAVTSQSFALFIGASTNLGGGGSHAIYSESSAPSSLSGALSVGGALSTNGPLDIGNYDTVPQIKLNHDGNNTLTIQPSPNTPAVNWTLTLPPNAGTSGYFLTTNGAGVSSWATRTLTAGAGLTGGGDLTTDRTFTLGTPSTLTVSSTNSASGTTHSHAITSSSNPGAAASLLASDAGGQVTLVNMLATSNLYVRDTSTGFTSPGTTVVSPIASNALRSTSYTSGLVGWNVNATGNAEFNNIDVRGAIHSAVFVYNELLATSGTLGIFKSAAKLRTDAVVPASPTYGTTTMTIDVVDQDGVSHAASQLFVTNDVLRIKDGMTGDTWFKVSAVSDQTTFWRYTAIIMAGSNNVTYRTGAAVADYGLSGAGFIILTADQTNAPYQQMATHTATFTSQDASGTLSVTPQLRTGNLNGSYGFASDTYGFATGQHGAASKSWLTVEQTNGIRIGNNTTTLGQWDTAGNIVVGQVTAGQSNVQITSGQINLRNNTTTRIRLASDGSGFLANSLIAWDTSGNLTVAGNATIAGWTVNSTSFAKDTGTNATSSGMAPVDFPFFAGATVANRATAPFRVTPAGALTATNANITGTITAPAGNIGGFTIGATSLTAGSGATTVGVDSGGTNPAFYAGSATPGSAPFRVTNAGALTATNANVTGAITATSGAINGPMTMSGASSSIAIGSTPPSSAAVGTGIWLDRTGMYGLASSVVQAQFDATNGAITAGAGDVRLDSTGISMVADATSRMTWYQDAGRTQDFITLLATGSSAGGSHLQIAVGGEPTNTNKLGTLTISAEDANFSNRIKFTLNANASSNWAALYNDLGTFKGLSIDDRNENQEPAALLDLHEYDGETAAMTDLAILRHTSSAGFAATNFGGSILFKMESSTTEDRDAVRIGALWSKPTDASRTGVFVVQTVTDGAALTEIARFGPVSNFFKGEDVASAAGITPTGNVFHVTGTTTITSISSVGIKAGTRITIIFDGALTFTDGSNLILAGNFITTADDSITLVYDGALWIETNRSVN